MGKHQDAVREFVAQFQAGDRDGVAALLSENVIAYITQSDGSARESRGRDAYADAVTWMDPVSANLRMNIPQILTIEPGLVMVMVEVHAARYGKTLHNFSGQLLRFDDNDLIDRIWMVEALPAYSDEFWSTTAPA